jgi:hypothetical protein
VEKNMKNMKNCAAQGDIMIRRVEELPSDAVLVRPQEGKHIVAHSETGHHHFLKANGVEYFSVPNNPLIAYLRVENGSDLIHDRSFDTHETIRIPPGIFEIRRQREHTPEGWRRVED